jgi:hypothetical protein
MIRRLKLSICILGLIIYFSHHLLGQEVSPSDKADKSAHLSDLDIDMQWFMSYLSGKENDKTFNQFLLNRGYVTIKKKINKTFSGRITNDITVDKEGDGEGDVKVRVKYLYLKTELPSFGVFHKPYFEFGLVHRPWLDFEEHVNFYRVQGTMFVERNDILNSADYGIVLFSLLGGEMDENYKKTVNKNYAGKYGSFAVGVVNGGGYHAREKNKNKSLEGRITIRPFHKIFPGLQFSYNGAFGKGNTAEAPDWSYNLGYISYESSCLILTGSYFDGKGNSKGSAIKDTISFEALPQNGYSLFGEWKLFESQFSIIGRYDYFTREFPSADLTTKRTIAGLAFHFVPGSTLLLDYDYLDYSDKTKKNSYTFEIAVEFKY